MQIQQCSEYSIAMSQSSLERTVYKYQPMGDYTRALLKSDYVTLRYDYSNKDTPLHPRPYMSELVGGCQNKF